MYQLITTDYFLRQSRKFFRKHPDLKPRFAEVVETLRRDPSHPSLRIHPLHGKLKDIHAVSLAYTFRITLTLKVTEREVILLDIGSHDDQ